MTDPAAQKLQNLSIQDTDINPQSTAQDWNALRESALSYQEQLGTNQHEKMSVDQNNIRPTTEHTGDKIFQNWEPGPSKQLESGIGRKMSEREMLGYQNDYGGTFQSSAQMEYIIDSDEDDDRNNFVDLGAAASEQHSVPTAVSDQEYYMSTGQPLIELGSEADTQSGMISSDDQIYSPDSSQLHTEDILGSPDVMDETFSTQGADVGVVQNMDYIDPENWAPHMDPDRSRRSRSPERSLSPPAAHGDRSSSQNGPGRNSLTDKQVRCDSQDTNDVRPVAKQISHPKEATIPTMGSEQEDTVSEKDSRLDKIEAKHKIGHIPRPLGSPKVTRAKKPLELPPWNDNVVIPPPPRMKPTMIGKQPDLPSPPRPMTAPSSIQYRRQDGSSDSGVEEERSSKVDRKAAGDAKKKYGIDSKNVKYKPGGGNIKIFSEKIDTASVGARTDTKPRASMSPRGSMSSEKSPLSPRLPSPNVKSVKSKIGSMDNARHSPGGGNVKVLSTKVDYSNVGSKVGSKDKIDHKPKGGDKKIQSMKLSWSGESKVGSLKNVTHSAGGGNVKILDEKIEVKAQSKIGSTANIKHKPGGGDKKIETQKVDFSGHVKSKVGSMDNVKHKAHGGDITIFDEKLEYAEKAASKVGSMDKVTHQPGGGDKKIETQKLSFKETAKARTDSGASSGVEKRKSATSSRSESVASQSSSGTQE